jgi:hypothetical protein
MIKTDHLAISFYVFSLMIVNIVYIAVFVGVFVSIPEYIRILYITVQAFLCLILMIRFNPFRENPKLHNGDTMFIFGAGYILFTNVVLVELTNIPIIGIKIKKLLSFIPSSR